MRTSCCNFRCYEFRPCTKYICAYLRKCLAFKSLRPLASSFLNRPKLPPPTSTFPPAFSLLRQGNNLQHQARTIRIPSVAKKPQKPFSAVSHSPNDRRFTTVAAVFLSSRVGQPHQIQSHELILFLLHFCWNPS